MKSDQLKTKAELIRELHTLRKSEQNYRQLFKRAPHSYQSIDIDGNIISVNQSWLQLLGYEESEVTGRWFGDFLAPEFVEHFRKYFPRFKAAGKISDVQFKMVTKEGLILDVEFEGRIGYDNAGEFQQMHCVLVDITERKKTEKELIENEERYRTLAEAAQDTIFIVNRDDKIEFVNTFAAKQFGKNPDDIIGKNRNILFPPNIAETQSKALQTVFSTCESLIAENEVQFGERKVWVNTQLVPIIDAEGKTKSVLGISREITERKQSEEKLKEKEEQLRTIMEASKDYIWLLDTEFKILYGNRTGPTQSIKDLIGISILSLIPKKKQAESKDHLEKALKSKDIYQYEIDLQAADGSSMVFENVAIPIKSDGQVVGLTINSRDITERKQVEKALIENEERYRLLFDNAPDAYFISDLKGKTVDINTAAETLLRINKQEIVGKNFLKLGIIPKDQLPIATKLITSIIKGKPFDGGKHSLILKDGSNVEIDLRLHRIKVRDKTRILGIARDITEQKKAEEATKESEEQFQNLFNSMREGFALCEVICNKKGVPIDYRFLKINPGFEKQSGMNATTSIGKTIKEIYPDIESKWIERYGRVAITQEAIHFEDYNHNTGKYYDAKAFSSSKGKFAMIFKDITQQKKADEALRLSEEKYRNLVETSQDLIFSCDTEGRFTYLNPAWETVVGYREDEMLGRPFSDFKTDDQVEKDLKMFKTILKGQDSFGYETVYISKSGESVYLVFNARFIKDVDGNVIGTQGTAHDITERKLAEEEIQKFKSIADNAHFGMAISDMDGTINYVNQYFADMHGYNQAEMTGKPFAICHNEEQLKEVLKVNKEFLATGNFKLQELWHQHKDGSVFPTLMSGILFHDRDERPIGMAATAVDITERKQVQEALKKSEQFLRESQEVAKIGSYILDISSGTWQSTAVLDELFGIDLKYNKDISGWLQIVHPEDQAEMQDYFATNVLTNHDSFNKDYRIKKINNQQERWVYGKGELEFGEDGNPIRMIGTIQDITERKQVEEVLRESEEKFSKAFHSAPTIIAITRMEDGRIVDANDAFVQIVGYNYDELIGKTTSELQIWANPKDRDHVVKTLKREGKINNVEVQLKTKSGEIRTVLWSGDIVKLGGEVHLITIAADITERKLAEEELKKSLAEKQTLLNEVHHRVKNNLQIIISLYDMTKDRLEDPLAIELIEENNQKIHSISHVHNMLYRSDRFDEINFKSYLTEMYQQISGVYGWGKNIKHIINGIDITIDLNRAVPLGMVISELLINAYKHGFSKRDRGTIQINLNMDTTAGKYLIAISNDGDPIDPDRDPFTSGSSTGLQLCRTIIELQLGGTLRLASAETTEFQVEIPIQREK